MNDYYRINKPKNKTVIVNDFLNKEMMTFENSEIISSSVFEDLKIKLNDVFE